MKRQQSLELDPIHRGSSNQRNRSQDDQTQPNASCDDRKGDHADEPTVYRASGEHNYNKMGYEESAEAIYRHLMSKHNSWSVKSSLEAHRYSGNATCRISDYDTRSSCLSESFLDVRKQRGKYQKRHDRSRKPVRRVIPSLVRGLPRQSIDSGKSCQDVGGELSYENRDKEPRAGNHVWFAGRHLILIFSLGLQIAPEIRPSLSSSAAIRVRSAHQ
jgi:hypothetical protein